MRRIPYVHPFYIRDKRACDVRQSGLHGGARCVAAASTHQYALRCDLPMCRQTGRQGWWGWCSGRCCPPGRQRSWVRPAEHRHLPLYNRKKNRHRRCAGRLPFRQRSIPRRLRRWSEPSSRHKAAGLRSAAEWCIRHAVQLFAGSWCDDQGSVAAHVDAAGGSTRTAPGAEAVGTVLLRR